MIKNPELEFPKENFQEIVEGKTKIVVPKKSLTEKVPPKKPAFFNPKAKLNRDFSIIAYAGFLKIFMGLEFFLKDYQELVQEDYVLLMN